MKETVLVDDITPTPESAEEGSSRTSRPRRRAASRPAGPPAEAPAGGVVTDESAAPAEKPKRASRKKAAPVEAPAGDEAAPASADEAEKPKKATRKRATAKKAAPASAARDESADEGTESAGPASPARMTSATAPLFQAPQVEEAPAPSDSDEGEESPAPSSRRRGRGRRSAAPADVESAADALTASEDADESASDENAADEADEPDESGDSEDGARRRRRRRGGRRRRRGGDDAANGDESSEDSESGETDEDDAEATGDAGDDEGGASRRRRRRRRRGSSDDGDGSPDDPPNTVTRVREPRSKGGDDVTSLKGSTRLEAKKQRRREGREAGRRRAPILTEAEFLARRESVNRVMVVRQEGDRTQIAVLEDGVLVEHYVTRGSSGSMVGNVYLGRVQNVLPSMEAAFIDIGRGRNAVLYAGEVNWDAAGLDGQPKRIEFALKSGDPVLVQVTKDPVGQKGARLTSQISLPGRFLVFVPDGSMTGISRKLPDNERSRLKKVLKRRV